VTQIKLDPELEKMGMREVIELVCKEWDVSELKRVWFKFRKEGETRYYNGVWGVHTCNQNKITGELTKFRISCFVKGSEADYPVTRKSYHPPRYGGELRPACYMTRKEACIYVFGHEFFHYVASSGRNEMPNTEINAVKCGKRLVERCREKGLV
jgi:hypothetical protein